MKRAILMLAALALLVSGVERAKAGTITVTPTNLNGWNLFGTDANGVAGNNPTASETFVTGPATPPLGIGSLQLTTGNGTTGGDGAAQVSSSNFDQTFLSQLTALSYSTYDTQNNGQQFPYLKLNVELSPGSGTYDQLFFEPPYQTPSAGNPSLPDQGATVMNQWQTWNALEGGWWDNNGVLGQGGFGGVGSLSTFLATYPNAIIVSDFTDPSAPAFGVSLRVGYASPTDQFNGYIDNFTIAANNGTLTYNFDPNAATVTPEPSTLTLLGIGAVCSLGYGWRRRRQRA